MAGRGAAGRELRVGMRIQKHPYIPQIVQETGRKGMERTGPGRLGSRHGFLEEVDMDLAFGREGLEGQREVLGGH